MLKVTFYSGGQMTAWPVFAWCNGGQKTVLPKQNGLLTTDHRSNRWSRGRWSEGGTPDDYADDGDDNEDDDVEVFLGCSS